MILPAEPPYFQISVKGIVEYERKIILLKDEQDQWELPGGRIEHNETPEDCLQREIREELNLSVSPTALLDVWMHQATESKKVCIVTYSTKPLPSTSGLKLSFEHKEFGLFDLKAIEQLNMPSGYKNSIAMYFSKKI